jgi:3',5'-cyclic AMP phosphodiesterase CpdA
VGAAPLVALAMCCAGCAAAAPARAFSSAIPAWHDGGRFVVAGDLQRTSFLELWRESNDEERRAVVAAIAAERPAFVAFTGDLVFDGSSGRHWADFDAVAAPLHDAGIPAVSALGNHDLWAGADARRFFARFPGLGGRRRFVVAYGPLRLVFLDSNVDAQPPAEWAAQKRWYDETLSGLDRDPEVRGVLVLLHHPPFTNSTVTGDEPHVARDLVPAFLAAHKALAMMSGHVHSYERFRRGDKTFVVSGGGGGPRARLATGSSRRHPDDLYAGPPLRDFNYLRITVGAAGLDVEVRGLPKGGRAWATIDRFALPWP